MIVGAVWSAGQLAAAVLPDGLQPMTSMLEQHLLQMAAARDPSWIAMCDDLKHGTRDDCRWHRLAGRPTWSAGRSVWLAHVGGRWTETDGLSNLLAAAIFVVSESLLEGMCRFCPAP